MFISINDPKSTSNVLEAAKKNDVEHKTLSLYRGLLLLDEGKAPDAVSEFEKAITLDPGYVAAHLFLGDAFLRQAKREGDAEKCYRDALELDPDNDEVHTRLLNLLLDRRQFNQIEEHAEKFLDNDVFFKDLANLTKALISDGASQIARSILRKALARPQKSFKSMISIAASASADGCDLIIADEAYKAASELDPERSELWEMGACAPSSRKRGRGCGNVLHSAEAGPSRCRVFGESGLVAHESRTR